MLSSHWLSLANLLIDYYDNFGFQFPTLKRRALSWSSFHTESKSQREACEPQLLSGTENCSFYFGLQVDCSHKLSWFYFHFNFGQRMVSPSPRLPLNAHNSLRTVRAILVTSCEACALTIIKPPSATCNLSALQGGLIIVFIFSGEFHPTVIRKRVSRIACKRKKQIYCGHSHKLLPLRRFPFRGCGWVSRSKGGKKDEKENQPRRWGWGWGNLVGSISVSEQLPTYPSPDSITVN